MKKDRSIIWTIKKTSGNNWYESFVWLVYILLGSLAPIYISILILLIAKQSVCMLDFTRHAQFAIYSASILATSTYLIGKDKTRPFPRRGIFMALVIIGLITSTSLFASVTIFSRIKAISRFLIVDEKLVMNLSLIVFTVSIVLAFLVNVLDSVIPSTEDLNRLVAEQSADLDKDFEDLGEKDE